MGWDGRQGEQDGLGDIFLSSYLGKLSNGEEDDPVEVNGTRQGFSDWSQGKVGGVLRRHNLARGLHEARL